MIKTRKMKNFSEEAFFAEVAVICLDQMPTETEEIDGLTKKGSILLPLPSLIVLLQHVSETLPTLGCMTFLRVTIIWLLRSNVQWGNRKLS